MLTKASALDYATAWSDPPSGGSGSLYCRRDDLVAPLSARYAIQLSATPIAHSLSIVRVREGAPRFLLLDELSLSDKSITLRDAALADDVYSVSYWATTAPSASILDPASAVIWAASDAHAFIVIQNSGSTATTSGSVGPYSVRATRSMTIPSYWETVYQYIGDLGSGDAASYLGAGIATAQALLNHYVGQTTASCSGPYALNGGCYYNAAPVAMLTALASGQRIGHAFDPSTGTYQITLNGMQWTTVTTGLVGAFYPMATLGKNTQSMMAYFDPATLLWSPPAGHHPGVA